MLVKISVTFSLLSELDFLMDCNKFRKRTVFGFYHSLAELADIQTVYGLLIESDLLFLLFVTWKNTCFLIWTSSILNDRWDWHPAYCWCFLRTHELDLEKRKKYVLAYTYFFSIDFSLKFCQVWRKYPQSSTCLICMEGRIKVDILTWHTHALFITTVYRMGNGDI